MSTLFNFKIGLFNAWLPVLVIFIISWFLPLIDKKAQVRLTNISWCSYKEKNTVFLGAFIMFLILIIGIWKTFEFISIFFLIGTIVYIVGIFSLTISYLNYIASSGNKKQVVGFYKISRNPIFFFTTLSFVGVSIASASPVLMILTVIHFQLSRLIISAQEKHFKKIYGTSYKKYLEKVHRFF